MIYQNKVITVSCNLYSGIIDFISPNMARSLSDVVQQLKNYDYGKYKYAPGRESFDDLPKTDETEFSASKEKFISLLENVSEEIFVKYIVVNAIRKKDGTLYKNRSLHLATFPYTDDYFYCELIAYNKTDSLIEIKLNKKEMIFCPNEDEFTILSLNILPSENIDILLNMIETGNILGILKSEKQSISNDKTMQDSVNLLPLFEEENGILQKVNLNSKDSLSKQYLTKSTSFGDRKSYCLIVPEFITSIEDDAFCQCDELYKVHFEGNLHRIGNRAFLNCKSLCIDHLPDSVLFIGKQAFKRACCSTLCEIPQSINEIEEQSFSGSGLRWFALHSDIKRIKKGAFKNCKSLSSSIMGGECFIIPEGVLAIESEAFSGCESLQTVKIPVTLTEIADDAFEGCSKLEISAPKGSVAHRFAIAHNIPFSELQDEFEYSKNKLVAYHGLKSSVTLSGNIKTIGKFAFRNGIQREISIADGVSKILERAFIGCSSLRSVSFPGTLEEIGSKSFSSCKSMEVVSLPYGLKRIGSSAFRFCDKIKEVVIPETVEIIEKEAFFCCESLKKMIICGQNTILGEWAISNNSDLVIIAPKNSPAEDYAKEHHMKFERL